jgi:hypothetical protein
LYACGDRSKTIQNQKAFEEYQALANGFLKCISMTHCTHVVDRSNTIQNQIAFEAYQALANGFLKCVATIFVALEGWRKTTRPVVRVWLIVPKPSRSKKPLKPIKL